MSQNENILENPSRRNALRRLGLVAAAAYIIPEVLMLSEARASSGEDDEEDSSSSATPPTPPTPPSNVDEVEADAEAPQRDACQQTSTDNPSGTVSISQSSFDKAQAAVDAGYAKPLEAIWPAFISNYSGKVIGIEFTGFRWRPRYRFRAVSALGHLETVVVSARTGEIEEIVGC